MSRAFVKEDLEQPEPEKHRWFRAFRRVGLNDLEPQPAFSSNDLVDVVLWAVSRPSGSFLIRDADGQKLAEIK